MELDYIVWVGSLFAYIYKKMLTFRIVETQKKFAVDKAVYPVLLVGSIKAGKYGLLKRTNIDGISV